MLVGNYKQTKITFDLNRKDFPPQTSTSLHMLLKAEGKIAVNILQFFFCYLIFLVLLVIILFSILKVKDNAIIMDNLTI